MGHVKAIFLSGLIWFVIGLASTFEGLYLIAQVVSGQKEACLLKALAPFAGDVVRGGVLAISLALGVGLLKGRFLLAKTVRKVVKHILNRPSPVHFWRLYLKRYLVLVAVMVGLGVVMWFAPIPFDVMGAINVIIGTALIQAALLYVKHAMMLKRSV